MNDLVLHARIFLESIGWRDVVDIIVVAFLLYQVLTLIRGTQAVQLLVGLGVLFMVDLGAQVLHLRLLQYIFSNAGQVILIATVVLFQPELRRALDQVGRLSVFHKWTGGEAGAALTRLVDEVIRAAASLSEERTGALIVFERGTGLENIAGSGVRINGDVTAEMLTSLFYPNSPLHDGAVIIRNRRLVAAGCVLPLAEALPGVGRMGTRHRAAIGLTLQSDAVILVVSDETGLISVADSGKLLRGLDVDTLREHLIKSIGADHPHGRSVVGPLVRGSAVRMLGRKPH